MTRNGLILLQVVGGLSLLPYPFVLLANIMSIAAPGHHAAGQLPWILLCFYPLVWIGLFILSWRAMARGAAGLAFGMSAIPALATILVVGIYLVSWIGFGLGTAGIGKGALHSTIITNTSQNPLVAAIQLAGQDIQPGLAPGAAVEKALHEIDANPALLNVPISPHGTPLNVALSSLHFGLAGSIYGDPARHQERIALVRALVDRGARLSADEAVDLQKSWTLRRALYDGPVTTSTENPLVWRIVTHDRGDSKPFNPLTDPLPPRHDGPVPFVLKESETSLLNRATRLHGTPLYAALLEGRMEAYTVIIPAGARLSAAEDRDPAAAAALRSILERHPDLQAAYSKAP